jgi:hypothetical protein
MIQEGIYTDLSSDDYHNDKHSISRSSLMDFKRNKRKYWAKHLDPNRPPAETKESWIFGTAFHTLILEPHLFDENYFIMPPKVLKRDNEELFNVHKQAEKEAEETKKQVLSFSEHERLRSMQEAIRSNERARKLVEAACYESSYFWKDEHSGLMLKARPDILNGNIYIDLKTIDDASPHSFQKSMAQYGNHIQCAMVRDGVYELSGEKLSACINLCIETKWPHCIGIYIIDDAAIESGHIEYKNLLLDMKSCITDNTFSDYDICTIGLPNWYK